MAGTREPMPRGTRPTEEQKAAREQLTEARARVLERKQRTRKLIQLGGVLAAYGFDSPEQVDLLMRAMVGDEENRRWLRERGVTRTERWAGDSC